MSYPSAISEEQWALIKEHFDTGNYGKSRKYSQQNLVNTVFNIVKTGCQWRQLPNDFPNYKTVFSFYKRAKDRGVWERMMQTLVEKSPLNQGRSAAPSYRLIDSQSVKTTSTADDRGLDGGGGKVKGRKRHIVTDTEGHLLHVKVHAAKPWKSLLETY